MRLVRFVARAYSNLPQWGELEDGVVHATGSLGLKRSGPNWRQASVEFLAPVTPTKIIGVGKNYRDHIAEMGGQAPRELGLFLKGPNSLAADSSVIPYPAFTNELHFEGELALAIGKRASKVTPEEALDYVLGYTCALDLSARDAQREDLQWIRAKSADGFCPVGPWLETNVDPFNVLITTRVNGEIRQHASTAEMITDVPHIIAAASSFMTLEPGDLILTGTPSGVGALQPGDEVEVCASGVSALHVTIGEKEA
ncbi:MAG TPA: fumarylacetoacetate hydrolase family protein [Deinococcales bacterium]|nr:fumarylacetoacetate hydrolase family protein [Deinococcales bacterium]